MCDLTKAAVEALEVGVRWEMEGAIANRHISNPDAFEERNGAGEADAERDRQTHVLLACAEVLGTLQSRRLAFRDFDGTIPAEESPETVAVDFTPEAIEWLEELRGSVGGHLEAMERTSTEGNLAHCQAQAFLLRTLDRVLVGEREAVIA